MSVEFWDVVEDLTESWRPNDHVRSATRRSHSPSSQSATRVLQRAPREVFLLFSCESEKRRVFGTPRTTRVDWAIGAETPRVSLRESSRAFATSLVDDRVCDDEIARTRTNALKKANGILDGRRLRGRAPRLTGGPVRRKPVRRDPHGQGPGTARRFHSSFSKALASRRERVRRALVGARRRRRGRALDLFFWGQRPRRLSETAPIRRHRRDAHRYRLPARVRAEIPLRASEHAAQTWVSLFVLKRVFALRVRRCRSPSSTTTRVATTTARAPRRCCSSAPTAASSSSRETWTRPQKPGPRPRTPSKPRTHSPTHPLNRSPLRATTTPTTTAPTTTRGNF